MKAGKEYYVVLVTAPNIKVARKLAQGALRAKLLACANIIPKIESHYWWKGEIESSNEVLVIFKTTRLKVSSLENFVIANHPYDTPEFIALRIDSGNRRYLAWISANVK